MKNRRSGKLPGLLLIVLIVAGAVIWGLFTGMDRASLQRTLDETVSFTKVRIQKYEDYTANDRVKSLVRLLDKTSELSISMKKIASYGQQDLDEYIEEQRLSGAFVLDENLKTVLTSTPNEDELKSLEEQLMQKDYMQEILAHAEETYTERMKIEDAEYDVAIVPRKDASGLVIAYSKKDGKTYGDMTLDSVFEGFPVSMNGVIVVCLDDVVASTNQAKLLGKTTKELQNKYNSNLEMDGEGIFRSNAKNGIWYGCKDKMGEYVLYVFYPSAQVFITRTIVCVVYAAIAILVYLFVLLVRSNIEKSALKQSQKRMRIINALGTAYSSITLFDLRAKRAETVKKSDDDLVLEGDLPSKEVQRDHVSKWIDDAYREGFLQFVDMDTVVERLKDHPSLTYTSQTKSGKWLLSVIVPQRFDKNGNMIAVLLANRDITKEKIKELEQEKALRSALAVAEHANKAKTNFLNSISHDIRTPMNAVIGFTALATTHIDNKELVMEYLKKINISGRHLLSLINDVLDMSRIESGVVKLEEVKVHLPDVFQDLRSIIQGNINSKHQELYIDTQNVVHEDIITDKLRLNQVLLNIISNAIKFTPTGGLITIRVVENPCRKEGYASFSFRIKDTGIGMSKEFQEHIFDAFAREQTVTKSGIQGTGLGMAISKHIIDMMGGTIAVKSETGKGSEFTVSIECKIAPGTVKYKPVPELQGARALVVDDDTDTCINVCKMLRDIEMDADWTTSGKEAVIRAKEAFNIKKEFKAYIIDWQLPDLNGIETVRRIRKVIGEDTPIIILTAYDWTDIAEEAREAGVTAFVSKPLFLSELRNVLTKQATKSEDIKGNNDEQKKKRHAGKHVLLVEDNELNREIATAILEEAGMIVDSVGDGTDAVARMGVAKDTEYDLILMDIQMPKMDGYTATREIRTLANNKKANIPIVAMTANAFEEDKKKAFQSGMNAHISKPITIEVILDTMDQIFGERKGCVDNTSQNIV